MHAKYATVEVLMIRSSVQHFLPLCASLGNRRNCGGIASTEQTVCNTYLHCCNYTMHLSSSASQGIKGKLKDKSACYCACLHLQVCLKLARDQNRSADACFDIGIKDN